MNRRHAWVAALTLSAAVALLYGMILSAPDFNEDISHIRELSLFGLPFGAFWDALTSKHYFHWAGERTYQPLVTFLHYWTHGNPAIYRGLGLALHAFNAFLVFCLGGRLTRRFQPALGAALLFALFPCSTETVDVASFKGHLLGFTFMLAALLCWIRAVEESPKKSWLPLVGVYTLFSLGLLAKETGLVSAGFMALYVVCFEERSLGRAWRMFLGLAPIAALYLWWRFSCLIPPPISPSQIPLLVLLSMGWYLKMLLWPHPLCLESSPVGGLGYWLLPIIYIGFLWTRRRNPLHVFCLLWILLGLLPVMHFISFANVSPVADRYLYISSAGLSLLLSEFLDGPKTRYVLAGLLLAWGCLTARRNGLYRQPRQLWEQTAACAPKNPRAHYILALTCFRENDIPAAERAMARVLSMTPSPGAHTFSATLRAIRVKTAPREVIIARRAHCSRTGTTPIPGSWIIW